MNHTWLQTLTLLVALLYPAMSALCAEPSLADMKPTPLNARSAPFLETEEVGIPSTEAWVTLGPLYQTSDKKTWRQMLVKKESRAARRFWVITLTLNTGEVKEHGPIKGYGQSKTAWSGDKLYFTTWLPGGFHVYDPDTDAITELPMPFENADLGAFRISVSPDGVLTMGGGGVTEVSTYDPKNGTLVKHGLLSDKHGFVYELGSDDRFVYAALRGKSPWELVAIDKRTKERKTVLTAPVEGYMNISGTTMQVRPNLSDTNAVAKHYRLADGQAAEYTPEPPKPAPPAATAAARPQVVIDESPLFEGRPAVAVHHQNPSDTNEWKVAHVSAPLASESTLALTALADGRIAALGGPYNPAVVFDPKTGEGKQAPFANVSGRCMLAIGPVVYASGYPNTALIRWDTTKPISNRVELPGRPAIAVTDPRSNPRLVTYFSQRIRSGGHMGVRMFRGADDCVYIATARHRHNLGFDVVWYDPANDTHGEIEDNGRNDHLAISWANPLEGGRKLIVSTTVQHNRQLDSPVPDSARLIVVDLVGRTYLGEYTPLPGFKTLTGVVEVAPNKIVGLAPDAERKTTYVYRYNLSGRKVEQVIRYEGLILGLQGTTALPGKGHDFTLGPDGKIWTGMETAAEVGALLRIDPATLEISPLGRIHRGSARFAFVGNDVYLNGGQRIQRLSIAGGLAAK